MKLPYFVVRDRIPRGSLRGSNDLFNILLIAFPLGVASLLAVGGPGRWQGEQYTVARQFPGSPYSWAALLALAALIYGLGVIWPSDDSNEETTGPRGLLIVCGAFLVAAWCFTYAVTVFVSGQMFPDQVALVGPWQWSFWATFYMVKVGQHLDLRSVDLGSRGSA